MGIRTRAVSSSPPAEAGSSVSEFSSSISAPSCLASSPFGAQHTLGDVVSFEGVGVHSGHAACLTLYPADEDTGLIFVRTGLSGQRDTEIRAVWSEISATALCTVLGDPNGVFVSTVEHLLAALRALGVDNAVIEVDGPEVPIMDGSSSVFIDAIRAAGLCAQKRRRKVLRVLKPVRVDAGDSFGELRPYRGARFEVSIAYDHGVIGRQDIAFELTPESFCKDIARARTFGFMKDVEKLWANKFALGSSLENAVVLDDTRVINPEGTRWSDEFVRHKVLDAIGDLALAGMPIEGCYRSHKGGHRLNFTMLKALFDDPSAYEIVENDRPVVSRRDRVVGEASVGLEAAALRPETN